MASLPEIGRSVLTFAASMIAVILLLLFMMWITFGGEGIGCP